MKKIFTLIFISGLLITTTSKAQFALKEDFIYPAGPLVNAFNPYWTHISGAVTGELQVTSPGLTYPGYKNANALTNKLSLVAGNTEDVTGFIDLNGDMMLDAADTISGLLIPNLYYCFLINVGATTGLTANSGTGDYFSGIVPTINSTSYTARVYIRQGTNSGYQLGLKMNSNASNLTAWATGAGDNMVVGTTYLIAFRYTFNPGTKDDVASMWINPVLDGSIPAPDVTVTNVDASTTTDITKLGGVLFRQGTNTPSVAVDGIAAGASWHDVVLPINLNAFNAALQNSAALLNWSSANEQNIKGFSIERSVDGNSFETLGFVAAKNLSGTQQYTFSDALIQNGMNYYRLKIINLDGTFKYSSVVAIMNKQFNKTTLFPNPVRQTLTITHEMAAESAVVRILDLSGKQVLRLNLQKGATQTSLALPTLAAGIYNLVVENKGQKTTSKFVKE